MSRHYKKRVLVCFALLVFILFILIFSGCSTVTVFSNWQDLPKDKPIQITTKTGAQLIFQSWKIDPDSTVCEMSKPYPRIVPSQEIAFIATMDDSKTKIVKKSIVVLGCAGGVGILLYIFRHSRILPF